MIGLNNYALQSSLYDVLSNRGQLEIDVINERLYITQQTSENELTMYPYDAMETALEDFNTVIKLIRFIKNVS